MCPLNRHQKAKYMAPEINRKSDRKKKPRLLKTDFFKTPFIKKLTFFNLSPK